MENEEFKIQKNNLVDINYFSTFALVNITHQINIKKIYI